MRKYKFLDFIEKYKLEKSFLFYFFKITLSLFVSDMTGCCYASRLVFFSRYRSVSTKAQVIGTDQKHGIEIKIKK